jgi:hypothetical protein
MKALAIVGTFVSRTNVPINYASMIMFGPRGRLIAGGQLALETPSRAVDHGAESVEPKSKLFPQNNRSEGNTHF